MFRTICNILSNLLILALALIAAALILPKVLGYSQYAVLSGSMEPNIHVGAIIYAKEAEPAELETDDIITYQIGSGTMVTHRIVAIDEVNQTVTTKGDANDSEDGSPVPFSNIVTKYEFDIPYLGYLSIYSKTPLGIAAACGVLMVLILLKTLPDIFTKEEKQET